MHKKLMAAAVAGALAAPGVALAQTSTVQIGGSITVFYYHHDPNNPGVAKSGDILETSEPELFVRGEEKLGGDLSAWFQCTSSLDGMVGGAGVANGWCGRNSGIGFKGSWGNIWAGNWDTPHKLVFNRIRGAFGGTNPVTGGSAVILQGGSASGTSNPSGNVPTTNNPERFFRRQAQSWFYHSPVWSGFQIQGAFSSASETTGIAEVNPLKPRLWSLAAHYDNGPLYLGVGYERHNDYNPGNTAIGAGTSQYGGGDDSNWLVGAGYTFFGRLKLTGLYSYSKYDVTNTGDKKVKGYVFFADWNIAGPHTVRAAYGRVKDMEGITGSTTGVYRPSIGSTCGITSSFSCAGDTGAKWWNIHYEYAFSKRTAVLVAYNKMDNDTNAVFSLGKTAALPGNDQTAVALGIKHRF